MKFLILCLISASLSSSILTASVGQSCSKGTPAFQVTSFTVSPWPITTQDMVNVTMSGQLSTVTYMSEIWISSTTPNYFNNQQVYLSQQYNAGPVTFNFPYEVQYPSATWTATLTLRDSVFNIMACWTFSYTSV